MPNISPISTCPYIVHNFIIEVLKRDAKQARKHIAFSNKSSILTQYNFITLKHQLKPIFEDKIY